MVREPRFFFRPFFFRAPFFHLYFSTLFFLRPRFFRPRILTPFFVACHILSAHSHRQLQSKHRKCSNACNSWAGTDGTADARRKTHGVVDTRVLGRPDKWDGSEKACPNWSFVMKAHSIDQQLSEDMTSAEISTEAFSNESMTRRNKARSVQLYFVLIMLCIGRALRCIASAPHGCGMEAWGMLVQAYSQKNNARLVVMMLEVLAFPLDTNDVQSGDDGTADQGVRQTRGHRDSSSRRRSDEDASHHELAQVGNIPGHHTEATKVKKAHGKRRAAQWPWIR